MDYEKKYKEALERAKGMWEQGMMPERIEYIFPELKESEDERIRRKFIEALKECGFTHFDNEFTVQEALDWLEKQGEYKESPCDRFKREQPSHSCQDITELGRCALEKQGERKYADKK